MLSVVLIWVYMLLTCYIAGYAVVYISSRGKYICRYEAGYILAGFSVITVYSEAFSLFMGVGFWANLILLAILCVAFWILRKPLMGHMKELKNRFSISSVIVLILLGLLFSYGTSHGIMHYDSDLYHAQSIRWIEEYGVVRGLGNLHTRLAYNSASFCVSALYSMKFLTGQSCHCCAGFLAYIITLMCRDLFKKNQILKPTMANAARIVAIYYVLMIFDEMVSPASDYFMVLLALGVIILFLELLDEKVKDYYPYGMLSLMTLVVLSIKISGLFLILLVVYPAYLLIKDKKYGIIAGFLLAGVLTILPFVLRNVLLSGYLVYPYPAIDVLDAEYKIPKGVAEYDSKEIQVYGRGYTDVTRFEEPFSTWIKPWFSNLSAMNKLFFILGIFGILLGIGLFIFIVVKKRTELLPYMLVVSVMDICFLFWMGTSPNLRYGCLFLFMAPILSWVLFYVIFLEKLNRFYVFTSIAALFLAYKALTFGGEVLGSINFSYLVRQQDYGRYEVVSYELNGVDIYIPTEGNQVGYEPFPSAPFEPEAQLMGNDVKDGFKNINR